MKKIIIVFLLMLVGYFSSSSVYSQNDTVPSTIPFSPMYTYYMPLVTKSIHSPKRGLGVAMTTPKKFRQEMYDTLKPFGIQNWVHWEEDMYQLSTEYYPTIWGPTYRRHIPGCGWCLTTPNYEEIKELSNKYPKKIWFFLNEPSLAGQADVLPTTAIFHINQWKELLEPNSEWACCAVAMLAPWFNEIHPDQGLPWMNAYIENGGSIPDYWNIHVYLAGDINEYKQHMQRWWDWWEVHGDGKPTIISETSLLCENFDTQQQCIGKQKVLMTYLSQELLQDSRIHSILWWKSHTESTNNGQYDWLATHNNNNYTVLPLGEHFISLQE